MTKQSIFISLLALLTLSSQAICMEKKSRTTLARLHASTLANHPYRLPDVEPIVGGIPRPDPVALAKPYYDRPDAQPVDTAVYESLILLQQQLREAQQKNQNLPHYFFDELGRYLEQVSPENLNLGRKFTNLLQVAESRREPERVPTLQPDEYEDFDEDSLTSASSTE